jgi:hypothetical protein
MIANRNEKSSPRVIASENPVGRGEYKTEQWWLGQNVCGMLKALIDTTINTI